MSTLCQRDGGDRAERLYRAHNAFWRLNRTRGACLAPLHIGATDHPRRPHVDQIHSEIHRGGTGDRDRWALFAQGTPINAAAFDALVAQGPVADAATIASSTWASKIKQAGTLRLGGTQTSNLFSLLNEKDGKIRGFDAGLAQLITRYILGDGAKYQFTQVTSSTREQVLINDQVDMVFATYSITPARAEKISFAGPTTPRRPGCWSRRTTRRSSRTTTWRQEGGHAGGLHGACDPGAVRAQGGRARVPDAPGSPRRTAPGTRGCLRDRLHAAAQRPEPGHQQRAAGGCALGAQDPYGVGLPKGSDGVAFINAFLKKLEADGTWAKLWTVSIGQRTGSTPFRRRLPCPERWVRFPGFWPTTGLPSGRPFADMEAHAVSFVPGFLLGTVVTVLGCCRCRRCAWC
jgi:hypothetical protein